MDDVQHLAVQAAHHLSVMWTEKTTSLTTDEKATLKINTGLFVYGPQALLIAFVLLITWVGGGYLNKYLVQIDGTDIYEWLHRFNQ